MRAILVLFLCLEGCFGQAQGQAEIHEASLSGVLTNMIPWNLFPMFKSVATFFLITEMVYNMHNEGHQTIDFNDLPYAVQQWPEWNGVEALQDSIQHTHLVSVDDFAQVIGKHAKAQGITLTAEEKFHLANVSPAKFSSEHSGNTFLVDLVKSRQDTVALADELNDLDRLKANYLFEAIPTHLDSCRSLVQTQPDLLPRPVDMVMFVRDLFRIVGLKVYDEVNELHVQRFQQISKQIAELLQRAKSKGSVATASRVSEAATEMSTQLPVWKAIVDNLINRAKVAAEPDSGESTRWRNWNVLECCGKVLDFFVDRVNKFNFNSSPNTKFLHSFYQLPQAVRMSAFEDTQTAQQHFRLTQKTGVTFLYIAGLMFFFVLVANIVFNDRIPKKSWSTSSCSIESFKMAPPRITEISISHALVEWDGLLPCQLCFVNGIQLLYNERGATDERRINLSASATSQAIEGLISNSWYDVRLSAETDQGPRQSTLVQLHTNRDAVDQ